MGEHVLRFPEILNLKLVFVQISRSLLQFLHDFLILLIKQLDLLLLFPPHFLHILPVFLGSFVLFFGLVPERFLFGALLGQLKLLGLQSLPLLFQVLLLCLVGFTFINHFHFVFLLMLIESLLVEVFEVIGHFFAFPHFFLDFQKVHFELFDELVDSGRVLPFDLSDALLVLLFTFKAFLLHSQVSVSFQRQFLAVKLLEFFDFFVVIPLELLGGIFVLTSLFLLLVFESIVAFFQVFDVFFLLLRDGFELPLVAFLTLEKL